MPYQYCYVNSRSYLIPLVDEVSTSYISKKQFAAHFLLTKPIARWIARLQRFRSA